MTVNGDTDIDRNKTHQQLTVSARCPSLSIRDAKEFTLVVLQNKQWHNAVRNVSPSSVSFLPTPMLKWEHCRDLIFKAGNEYRKFEIPSRRYPGMHVESVDNLSSYLHVTLFPDEPRMTYLYDEDQDGIYVPLAEDNMNPETEAEYMWVHFDYSFPENGRMNCHIGYIWEASGQMELQVPLAFLLPWPTIPVVTLALSCSSRDIIPIIIGERTAMVARSCPQ